VVTRCVVPLQIVRNVYKRNQPAIWAAPVVKLLKRRSAVMVTRIEKRQHPCATSTANDRRDLGQIRFDSGHDASSRLGELAPSLT
jgi:hypothetical protein